MSAAAIDIDRARAALWALDAGVDRREWVRIGCAAKAAGLTFEDFNDWSATAGNYGGQGDTSDAWKSFKRDGGVNAGTLFHLAREAGWADPASDHKPQRDARRAAPLREWWERGPAATADHGYITRKHGTPDGLRLVSWPLQGWAAFKGRCLEGWLMVPVRAPSGELASIQFIGPNGGEKLNAFGCSMAGTFTVGTLEHGAPAYIIEGIGHAWSVNAVTGSAAVVSFGASNIEKATAAIKRAGAKPIIVPDRGKEREAAAAAARHGCAYAVLPADLADGNDVNDLHLERGADAVLAVLKQAVEVAANDNARNDARRRLQQDENARLQEAEHDTEPPSLSIDDMLNDCVWIASGSQVGRISNPKWVLPFSEFCDLTASCASKVEGDDGRRRRVLHAVTWKQHAERKTVMTRTFYAGAPAICADPDGATALNSWRPIERRKAARDVTPFLEQVEYLIGDDTERGAFLDWLAHIEQRPGVLPHYGWLHIAKNTGTGRNWLASVLARLWRGYVAPNVDLPALLESQFNGALAGRVLAMVDEVQEGGGENQFRHANRLKSIVNAEERSINPKFGRQFKEHNSCRWLVFSNHDNALPLNDTDRRWRVVRHDAAPRSPEVYARLYALLDDGEFINAVGVWLRDRDISAFNPGERPPMSDAKRAAVDASKSLMHRNADEPGRAPRGTIWRRKSAERALMGSGPHRKSWLQPDQ
ncbi:hypothetical protein OR16_15319 [Cupriavidus basilensis OR16]|uniref:Uncharacterized protein n=1 Tax=Cupriavidus basilensis OR16 TaxID=1127483 RepID=H1S5E4_9BURK|nr:DUF5906 domain-containing protein [Cupriavidus basilensis]EHP42311.1 hypothetical protein OR16_15319 [Cupriavidus basilensis OR16]